MRLERGERATCELLWNSYLFGFPRMQYSPGQNLVVWLPTTWASAKGSIHFGPRPPKRKVGKRKWGRPKPSWMVCEKFVGYLERVAGIDFLAAFEEWYDAMSNKKVSRRKEYDVNAYSLECYYIPMTPQDLRAARLQ